MGIYNRNKEELTHAKESDDVVIRAGAIARRLCRARYTDTGAHGGAHARGAYRGTDFRPSDQW